MVFQQAADRGKALSGVRQWALSVQARTNHNKATCALANKLARIGYATLRDGTDFDEPASLARRKSQRQSFALPA